MTDLKKAAQQALEALEHAGKTGDWILAGPAITTLKAALEQPEQEPEWLTGCPSCGMDGGCDCDEGTYNPPQQPTPQRKPLSDDELDRLWREPMSADWEHREYARAIEAAHNIKENT
jgi:hypothetical protein